MSSFTGPSISNTGLVFCYDSGNVQRSWKGKPTTNFIANPTEEMARGEFGQYRDLAPIFNTNGLVPYSLSMDIKVNKPGSVLIYMQNGSSSKYTFVNQSVNATTEYQRFYFNNLTPAIATASDSAATLATYTGYGSGITPTVKNIQLELGTFSTPFVNGTRSNTQALVDLVSNTTITANSLTYSSDGSFTLNGTTDYFSTGAITGLGSSLTSFTMEIWVNPASAAGNIISMSNANPQTNWNMPPISATGQTFSAKVWPNNRLYSSTYTLNTWYHLVLSFNAAAGAQYFYVNGEQVGSQTGITYSASNSANYLFFGQQNPGADNVGMFAGKIGNVKIYTGKALTSQEVKQNFIALRGRYGL